MVVVNYSLRLRASHDINGLISSISTVIFEVAHNNNGYVLEMILKHWNAKAGEEVQRYRNGLKRLWQSRMSILPIKYHVEQMQIQALNLTFSSVRPSYWVIVEPIVLRSAAHKQVFV